MKLQFFEMICSLVLSASMCMHVHDQEGTVLNDDLNEPLKMEIVEPWYRNTVYASMPVDELKVNLYPSVGINPGYVVGSTLRVQVIAESGDVVAQEVQADLPLTFFIRESVAIGRLPAGQYGVVAEMFDSSGQPLTNVQGSLCKTESQFTIAPPAPHEVVFDRHGICHVDGEAFFPIGMYWAGRPVVFSTMNSWRESEGLEPIDLEQFYHDIHDMGINIIQDAFDWHSDATDFSSGVRQRTDMLRHVGLRSFNGINVDQDDRDRVEMMANSSGLLAWYTFDEPIQFGESYVRENVAARYSRVCELDPYHPQIVCDNMVRAMKLEAPYADVLMPDVYPQKDGDMRVVGRVVAELKRLKGGKAVVWPVIQAFEISDYTSRPDGSAYTFGRLTYEEMRVVVFDAVACGATGITYYAYYSSEGEHATSDGGTRRGYLLDAFPDQREAMTKVNHQLELLLPAILTGEHRPTTIAPQDGDAHARAFVHNGKCYVLVTNPGRTPVDVRIGVLGVGDQESRDLYSGTTVSLKTGYFDLTLKPLEVFVFTFDLLQ